jgi:uncharacterized protein (DUF4415 family)
LTDFEWDETKRLRTIEERGLDFRDARHVFDGRPLYSYPSPRDDEDRIVSVGSLERRLICGCLDGAEWNLPHYFHAKGEGCRGEKVSCAIPLTSYQSSRAKPTGPRLTLRPGKRSSGRPKLMMVRYRKGEDTVVFGVPGPKRGVYLRLDPDVLDWFKADGRGYQTRINAVLRAFVRARKEAEHSERKSK